MQKQKSQVILAVAMLLIVSLIAGCGGGSGAQRPSGLSADAVVKNFIDAAKTDKLNEAALYVSPDSVSDTKTVIKYVTGQTVLDELKKSNVLSLEKVAERGDYAVVLATLQTSNSLKISIKPVGLTRIDGEWYIVEFDKIYQDAKYKVLQQLIANI